MVKNTTYQEEIPTVKQAPQPSLWYQNLFELQNIGTVLQDSTMIHQEDYSVGKKVERDGEEWFGRIPLEKVPLEQMNTAVFEHGFSLVVNRLEERWRPIRDYTLMLQEELLCRTVSCNLYLTPPTTGQLLTQSGFESHLDWMDVFVIQVMGTKLWSVANTPLIELSTADMKRKPSAREIHDTIHSNTYRDVLLQPGDVLYIPRGFLHNASTVSNDYIFGHMDAMPIQQEQTFLPSMHLTFGIEHLCDTTVEALVHIALEEYWKNNNEYPCDLTMFHLAVAEAARRFEECKDYKEKPYITYQGETRTGSFSEESWITCTLRQSVSALQLQERVQLQKCEAAETCPNSLENSSLSKIVQDILKGLQSLLQVDRAHYFFTTTQNNEEPFTEAMAKDKLNFCFPVLAQNSSCRVDKSLQLSKRKRESMQGRLQSHLERLQEFVSRNYSDIMHKWQRHVDTIQKNKWKYIDYHLKRVGR